MSLYQPSIEEGAAIRRFCSLFDYTPNPIILIDTDRVLTYCNDSYVSQFGTGLEGLLLNDDVAEAYESNVVKAFTDDQCDVLIDESTAIEFRRLVINNEVFCMMSLPVHAKLMFVSKKSDGPKKNTMALADKELINSVLESAPDAALILNYDSKVYVAANKRAEALFGYTEEEFNKLQLGDLSPGAMNNGMSGEKVGSSHIDKCVKTGKRVIFEWQIRHKNGTLIPCEISVFKLPTQNGTYVRTSVIDISFKKNFEQQIHKNKEDFGKRIDDAIKRQREDQLEAFVRDSPIPVVMLDNNMNYLFVAREWIKQFPSKNGDRLVGLNYYEDRPFVPQRWKLIHKQALKGKTIGMKRDMYVDEDGNDVWCRWDIKPWYKSEEEIGGIIIYAQNITEEVEAEGKMLEQERRFKHFFNSDSIGWIEVKAPNLYSLVTENPKMGLHELYQKDPNFLGRVIRYNQKIADIFGLSVHDTPESFEPIRYAIEGREEFAHKCFTAVRDKLDSFTDDVVIQNKYGEVKSLTINVNFSVTEGNSEILYGVQDVTDLKHSVKALRDSEERYRTMFDSNSLGVIYTNYSKNMVKINESFTKIFGYTEEDMQRIDENDMLLPAYVDDNKKISEDFKNGVKRYISVEKEYKRKNGDKLIAQTSSSALYDDAGNHYGNVTIIEDITERKTSERRIRKQNEELIKINQELDQFVYSAAHDLRAPIANVMGLVKLIRLEEISETAAHYLALQEKSLGKLDEFIRNIVDYSRNSRLELSRDELNFEEFVNEVVDQYRFSENAERLNIDIQVDQKGSFITDYNRLSVVMNNLISNAVRYMDVEKNDCFLNVVVEAGEEEATISVEDNGIGIEQEHLESIFELFYRANSSSKGTGIGLYIVKETVDKLHGKIDVSSEYTKGTTFKVTVKNLLSTEITKEE